MLAKIDSHMREQRALSDDEACLAIGLNQAGLTRIQIAKRLGISIQTFTREISHLVKEGAMELLPMAHNLAKPRGYNYWQGHNLTEKQLLPFIEDRAEKIRTAWIEASQKHPQGLTLADCQQIINQIGRFALNVINKAEELSALNDPDKKEAGSIILFYCTLPAVVSAIKRVQKDHPDVCLNEQDLIDMGLAAALEIVAKKTSSEKSGKKAVSLVVNASVYYWGGALAEKARDKAKISEQPLTTAEQLSAWDEEKRFGDHEPEQLFGNRWRTNEWEEAVPEEYRLSSSDDVEQEIARRNLGEILADILASLGPRYKKAMDLRYGLTDGRDRTLEEVGREFGVTRERIRRIQVQVLRKMRRSARSRLFREYGEALSPREKLPIEAYLNGAISAFQFKDWERMRRNIEEARGDPFWRHIDPQLDELMDRLIRSAPE